MHCTCCHPSNAAFTTKWKLYQAPWNASGQHFHSTWKAEPTTKTQPHCRTPRSQIPGKQAGKRTGAIPTPQITLIPKVRYLPLWLAFNFPFVSSDPGQIPARMFPLQLHWQASALGNRFVIHSVFHRGRTVDPRLWINLRLRVRMLHPEKSIDSFRWPLRRTCGEYQHCYHLAMDKKIRSSLPRPMVSIRNTIPKIMQLEQTNIFFSFFTLSDWILNPSRQTPCSLSLVASTSFLPFPGCLEIPTINSLASPGTHP